MLCSQADRFRFECDTKFVQAFVDSALLLWLLVRVNEKLGLKGNMSWSSMDRLCSAQRDDLE